MKTNKKELIDSFRLDSYLAVINLHRQHYSSPYLFTSRIVKNNPDIVEIVSDIFLKLSGLRDKLTINTLWTQIKNIIAHLLKLIKEDNLFFAFPLFSYKNKLSS